MHYPYAAIDTGNSFIRPTLKTSNTRLPLPSPHHHASHDSCSHNKPSHDSRTYHPLFGNLLINQPLQAACLQVRGFQLQEQLVISSGLSVVAELVVSKGEIV
jgi:hypothetical protein